MFNELVESVSVPKATNKHLGFLVSATFQVACLIALILIPFLCTQALPKAVMDTFLVAPLAPTSTPVPPTKTVTATTGPRSPRLLDGDELSEPRAIPRHVKVFAEPGLAPETAAGSGGFEGALGADLLNVLAEGCEEGGSCSACCSANPGTCTAADSARRSDRGSAADQPRAARLPRARGPGADSGRRRAARDHRRRRTRERIACRFRASAAGEGGVGRGRPVAVSADAAEWAAG